MTTRTNASLILDVRHEYYGYHAPGAVCRIRIYQREGEVPVVVATELQENQNTSITNLAEQLAAEVWERYLKSRYTEAPDRYPPFVWIEHYPGKPEPADGRKVTNYGQYETLDVVTFSDLVPRQRGRWAANSRVVTTTLGTPDWSRISREKLHELYGVEVGP